MMIHKDYFPKPDIYNSEKGQQYLSIPIQKIIGECFERYSIWDPIPWLLNTEIVSSAAKCSASNQFWNCHFWSFFFLIEFLELEL